MVIDASKIGHATTEQASLDKMENSTTTGNLKFICIANYRKHFPVGETFQHTLPPPPWVGLIKTG